MVDPRKTRTLPFMIQYVFCNSPINFIKFIEDVFDAEELRERAVHDGKVANAMFEIAGSLYEISQARGDFGQVVHSFHYYCDNAEEIMEKARDYDCEIKSELTKQDYGDEEAWFIDPFGNNWFIAKPLE